MTTLIYLIVPKDSELDLWEMEGTKECVLRELTTMSGVRSYTWADLQNRNNPFEDQSVFVFNWSSAADEAKCQKKFFELLGGKSLRVFMHFGGEDLDRHFRTAAIIRSKFENRFQSIEVRNHECFPYTGIDKRQFKWSAQIWRIQNDFKTGSLDVSSLVGRLDEAWTLASGYFNAQLPMRSMLEGLFPLYLTLSQEGPDVDKMAAIQATKQLLDRDVFRPVKLAIEANVGLRLRNDLQLPSAADDVSGFTNWFKELSKAYTELLELGDADPFGPNSSRS